MNSIDFTDFYLYRRFLLFYLLFPVALFFTCLFNTIYWSNNLSLNKDFKLLLHLLSFSVLIFGWFFLRNKIKRIQEENGNALLKLLLVKRRFIPQKDIQSLLQAEMELSIKELNDMNFEFTDKFQKSVTIFIYTLITLISGYAFFYLYKESSNVYLFFIPAISMLIALKDLVMYLKNVKKFKVKVFPGGIEIKGKSIRISNRFSEWNVSPIPKLSGFYPSLAITNGRQKIEVDYSPISADKMLFILLYVQHKSGKLIYA